MCDILALYIQYINCIPVDNIPIEVDGLIGDQTIKRDLELGQKQISVVRENRDEETTN